jgi:hypothetical protein
MERMVFFVNDKAAKNRLPMDRASQGDRLVIQYPVEIFFDVRFLQDYLAREPFVYLIQYLMVNPHSLKKNNAKSNKMEDPGNEIFSFPGSDISNQ